MPRGMGGRGGRGGRGGGRFRGGGVPRGIYYAGGMGLGIPGVHDPLIGRKFFKRPHSVRIPFKAVDDTMEHKLFPVTPSNLECFHGFQSVFTTQHLYDFTVDGKTYRSVDHYYQRMKVEQLTGVASEKFDDLTIKNYGNLAREIIRLQNISRKTVDQWRVSCGVEVLQKALLEKVKACQELRDALIKTGDKIIVHTFANDDFFGSGVPYKYVKDWSSGMEQNKIQVKFPMSFPLTPETVKHVPIFAKGRNVLGAILMILREKINTNQINNLQVTLSPVSQYVTPETQERSNRSNGAPKSQSGEIDFTMDYEVDSITTPQPTGAAAPQTIGSVVPAKTTPVIAQPTTRSAATTVANPAAAAAAAGKVKIALPGKAPVKK